MKTFEEQFPSLKGKEKYAEDYYQDNIGLVFEKESIIEHCLDKVKVREEIEKCPIRARAHIVEGDIPTCLISIKELMQRLGL